MITTRFETAETALPGYGLVASAFTVREVFQVIDEPGASGVARLVRRSIQHPFTKDYDAPPCLSPAQWRERFDLRHWGFVTALAEGRVIGRAAVAWRDAEITARGDQIAVLWDLRVEPGRRRGGAGRALFTAAAQWSRSSGARRLVVETQNINVPACRLYEAMGCIITGVQRNAYPELPDEVRITWSRDLAAHVARAPGC